MMRRIYLAGFLIAGNTLHSHAVWRQQSAPAFLSGEYYVHIARTLERGLFDLVFFADRQAVSARYAGSYEMGLARGDQDATRLDPVPILGLMSGATRHLGLGATRSTTYAQPYALAREFATLDHISGGRAAWNVVTSVNQDEARNYGVHEALPHDARYDRADEFMELTAKLWDGWQPDALKLDAAQGVYADATRVAPARHKGRYFECEGPLNIPRSPQGRPVIIQAGSSARGQDFAARWAEVVFSIQPDLARMQRFYSDLKGRLEGFGRTRDDLKILTAVMPFVGRSRAEAEELRERHNALADPIAGLATLSAQMNVDFSAYALDEPVPDIEVQGIRGLYNVIRELAGDRPLTLREAGRLYAQSILVPQVAGTASDIADWLQDKFEQGGADGFVVTPHALPQAFDAFVDAVVPELQRRGLYRHRYTGRTLRENLSGAAGEARHAA